MLDQEALHTFIDELQITICELHQALSETWFLPPPAQTQSQTQTGLSPQAQAQQTD
jgi:hypothetical protein